MEESERIMDKKIRDLVDLTKSVGQQKRHASDRATDRMIAIQEAQKKIRERGEFIPKDTNATDGVRVCF